MSRGPEYISLKEAAQMTGYSADYVGQLIRSGKLPGKQVFSNVAWMTTKEAIRAYTHKEKKPGKVQERLQSIPERVLSLEALASAYKVLMWGMIGLLLVFVVFLAYVLAVSIDHRVEERYERNIEYVL